MTDDNTRGAGLMAGSMTAFTVNDAFLKGLSDELPLFQTLFLRGIGTVLCLLLVARLMGNLRFALPRRDWGLIALRSAAEVSAAFFFLTALFHMPIANVVAILQALPLTVTLAAALVFGEVLGWRRLTAILLGFCGVLLIVRPGSEGFNIYSVYVLLAVLSVTVRDLAARRMSAEVPSILVALLGAVAVTIVFGGAASLQEWVPVSPLAAGQIAGAMVCVICGYILSVTAMRVGEVAVVASFRYTSLIVALVLGLAVFGEWPEPVTLLGAALIVGTGLFTLWRERRLARGAGAAPTGLRVR